MACDPGDRFKVTADTCNHCMPIGSTVTFTSWYTYPNDFYFKEKTGTYIKVSDVTPLKNNSMNLREKFALVFKGEPEKSFIKAGIMDTSEELTEEGWEIFGTWLLKKNGAEFKTVVGDPILEQMREE